MASGRPRLEAAERLVASVPCDAAIEKAQIEEVRRRIAGDRSGQTARLPGQEALKQVRRTVLGGSWPNTSVRPP